MTPHVELDLVVDDVTAEATDVISIGLARPDGRPLPSWEPGAHIDLILPIGVERQYSLCSEPSELATWRVAVLHEPESRGGSEWLHSTLRPQHRLRVRGPRNNFPLVEATQYLLIAGGIGITPLVPMARELDRRGAEWRLLYGGRFAHSMAFTQELSRFADRVTFWPQDEHGLLDLDSWLADPTDGGAVYCCGPEPLLQAVEERCVACPAGYLNIERFRPRPEALGGPRGSFEVELTQRGVTILVTAEQTIVEALESAGVEVPTSCREGTCGTCETEVIDGVPDHRDSFLLDDERADNSTIMICCSRSLTPKLVLDL
jgi:ferredoxin-NADP reductase